MENIDVEALFDDGFFKDFVGQNCNKFDSNSNDVKMFDSKYDFVIKNDGGVYIQNVIKLLTSKLNRDISVDELFCALIVNSDITKEWLVNWLKSRKIDNIIYDSDTDVKITRDEFLECVKELKRKNKKVWIYAQSSVRIVVVFLLLNVIKRVINKIKPF